MLSDELLVGTLEVFLDLIKHHYVQARLVFMTTLSRISDGKLEDSNNLSVASALTQVLLCAADLLLGTASRVR